MAILHERPQALTETPVLKVAMSAIIDTFEEPTLSPEVAMPGPRNG